ncbi:hypothetical protein IJG78_03800 [Candidatus Saccharibacteria bacterium]|nr:hypothetical protein [Candidatus Saccharibacteria bacterium]
MYDYRGIDGTGTRANPASGSNAVSYTIRKLADGNCWMSENLKLTLSTSHAYEVATFSGGTTSWTPNSGSGEVYDVAINGNTKANISVNGRNEWYYPWYAATAGQGTQSMASGEVTVSICPKGWRIPSSVGNLSYDNLVTTIYSITTYSAIQSVPVSFVGSGVYQGGNLNVKTYGCYWASTAHDASSADFLYFVSPNTIYTVNNYDKRFGINMRCVAIP